MLNYQRVLGMRHAAAWFRSWLRIMRDVILGLAVVSCGWIVLGFHLFVRKALSVHNDHATSTSWDHRHSEDWPGGANNSRKFSAQCSSDGHAQRERERERICVCVFLGDLGRTQALGFWRWTESKSGRTRSRGSLQVYNMMEPGQDHVKTLSRLYQTEGVSVFLAHCVLSFPPVIPKAVRPPHCFWCRFLQHMHVPW